MPRFSKELIALVVTLFTTVSCVRSDSIQPGQIESSLINPTPAGIPSAPSPTSDILYTQEIPQASALPTLTPTRLAMQLANEQVNNSTPPECTPNPVKWSFEITDTPFPTVDPQKYTPPAYSQEYFKHPVSGDILTKVANEQSKVDGWRSNLRKFLKDKYDRNEKNLKDITNQPITILGHYIYVQDPLETSFNDGQISSQLGNSAQSWACAFFINGETGLATAFACQSDSNYNQGGEPKFDIVADLKEGEDTYLINEGGILLLAIAREPSPGEKDDHSLMVLRMFKDLNNDGYSFTSCDQIEQKMVITGILNPVSGEWVRDVNGIVFHQHKR